MFSTTYKSLFLKRKKILNKIKHLHTCIQCIQYTVYSVEASIELYSVYSVERSVESHYRGPLYSVYSVERSVEVSLYSVVIRES